MKWTLRVALQIGLLASLSVVARGGNLLINPGAEAGNLTGWTVGGNSNPGVDNGSFDPGINPHSGDFDFFGRTGSFGTLTHNVSLVGVPGITTSLIDAGLDIGRGSHFGNRD